MNSEIIYLPRLKKHLAIIGTTGHAHVCSDRTGQTEVVNYYTEKVKTVSTFQWSDVKELKSTLSKLDKVEQPKPEENENSDPEK